MIYIAHFEDNSGRIVEEEFQVVSRIPQEGELYENETVKSVRKLRIIPEIGIETTGNLDFYRLRLTVRGKYTKDENYAVYLAKKRKSFNRLIYIHCNYDESDLIVYLNDEKEICRECMADVSHRADALAYLKELAATTHSMEEWFEEDYDLRMRDFHVGGTKVLAEVECLF